MSSHYEQELAFSERIHAVDRTLGEKMDRWEERLPDEQFRDHVRQLMEDCEDAMRYEGEFGDDANRLYLIARERLREGGHD